MPVILFDGVCNLCSGTVFWLIARDRKNVLRFAALQSDYGIKAARQYGFSTVNPNTLILIETGRAYQKSSAVLRIAQHLGGWYRLSYLGYLFPRCVRDFAYDYVARHRYRWFGKKETCLVPAPELMHKFVSE